MEGGLGPALGFGSLSRNGSASLVKVGSQGPRTGPPHGSEPAGARGGDGACSFCGARWEEGGGRCGPGDAESESESESGLRELGPGRERRGGVRGEVQTQPGYPGRRSTACLTALQPRLDPGDLGACGARTNLRLGVSLPLQWLQLSWPDLKEILNLGLELARWLRRQKCLRPSLMA